MYIHFSLKLGHIAHNCSSFMLEMGPRALCVLGKYPATELHSACRKPLRGWGDVSVIKSTYCLCRGPRSIRGTVQLLTQPALGLLHPVRLKYQTISKQYLLRLLSALENSVLLSVSINLTTPDPDFCLLGTG